MRIVTDTTTENIKWRRQKNQFSHHHHPNITEEETDPIPNPQIPSIIQSTRCKSTIFSLLLSTFSNNTTNDATINGTSQGRKKSNFSAAATFRGLGCTAGASQQVSMPAVIRTSADWQGKKAMKKKHKRSTQNSGNSSKGYNGGGGVVAEGPNPGDTFVDFQDVWCGPGIGFSADAAASVDCVVARRNASSRGKIDVDKVNHRESSSYFGGRRSINPELISFVDTDTHIYTPRSESFGPAATYYRHIRDHSSDGIAEIMILQGSLIMRGRVDSHDQFRHSRLDVDNMSYEQLIELGERIGYVNTGLKEDEMGHNIRKTKLQFADGDLSKHQADKKCSICQEEYEGGDEIGRLNCEHSYHFHCIKQWVARKNFCPVCKQHVVARN